MRVIPEQTIYGLGDLVESSAVTVETAIFSLVTKHRDLFMKENDGRNCKSVALKDSIALRETADILNTTSSSLMHGFEPPRYWQYINVQGEAVYKRRKIYLTFYSKPLLILFSWRSRFTLWPPLSSRAGAAT